MSYPTSVPAACFALAATFGLYTGCAAKELARDDLFPECPQQTSQGDLIGGGEASFVLRRDDKQRRCEVAIHNQLKRDAQTQIRFQLRLDADWPRNDNRWAAVFQIHSFPDRGEAWRCPLMALEIVDGKARAFNRWDLSEISDTAGGNCADKSTTIKSRELFSSAPVKFGAWIDVEIGYKPSIGDQGRFVVSIDGKKLADVTGPTMMNDRRGPYLKFGIYKPNSFTHAESYTVSYRNLAITDVGN